jgi:hypothetical protein
METRRETGWGYGSRQRDGWGETWTAETKKRSERTG